MANISIIGAGHWGSALALTAARAGSQVSLLGFHEGEKVDLLKWGQDNIYQSPEYDTIQDSDIVVLATPAQTVRSVIGDIQNFLKPSAILLIASKGIEVESGLLMTEVIKELLPYQPVAILSGPNFAHEVIRNKMTCTLVASQNIKNAQTVAQGFQHENFCVRVSSDVIGPQLGGALKNVLAIIAGIIQEMDLGENALMAFLTQGLEEITYLGTIKGAENISFIGYAGLGDLMLTCLGSHSRNVEFGREFVKNLENNNQKNSFREPQKTVEGFHTSKAVYNLQEKLDIKLPLFAGVYELLHNKDLTHKDIENHLKNILRHDKC